MRKILKLLQCALSGIELKFAESDAKSIERTASLDRIDSSIKKS